jgi:hypothetical protein
MEACFAKTFSPLRTVDCCGNYKANKDGSQLAEAQQIADIMFLCASAIFL